MMKTIKRLEGWQRLWLAASLLMLGVAIVWLPGVLERKALVELAEARTRVIADFEKAECLAVRSTPYTQLTPIPAGAPCFEIYIWRKDVKEKLPLILNNVLFPIDAHRREILFDGAMKGVGLAALGSLLLYAGFFLAKRRTH